MTLGKFEGEARYAEHFYEASLDGTAEELSRMEDGCGEYVALVEISDEDRDLFHEIGTTDKYAVVSESDVGFVAVWFVGEDGAEKLRVAYDTDDDTDDDV